MKRAALLFVLALAVRVAVMFALGLPREVGDVWDWAYEQGAVARALLRGEGYADAFGHGTGPTAWCGAVYPAFLALVLKVCGGPDRAAALAIALVHAVLSAVIAPLLAALGGALERPRVGRLAGWAWALHPGAVYYPLVLVWDSVFVAAGLTLLLLCVARAGTSTRRGRWGACGAVVGAVLLVNPAPLAVLPAVAAWIVLRGGGSRRWRSLLAFGLAAATVVAPWSARNFAVLGTANLKANLGVELWVGNAPGADGGFSPRAHPAYGPGELALYRALGEVGYARRCAARAWERATEEPAAIARLCVVRARDFWFGTSPFRPVSLRSGKTRARDWQGWVEWAVHLAFGVGALLGALVYRDPRGGQLLLRGAVLLFPLVYYVTHVLERYRFPLEPVATYLTAALAVAVFDAWRARRAA